METNRTSLTKPSGRELRVERAFDAPRELVWRAMTEPALLARWWARGNQVDVETHELQRGGHWRFVERAKDGVDGFEGRFREVHPPDRLVQTFEWDGMPGHVCIQSMELLAPTNQRTVLISTSLFHTVQERDGMLSAGAEAGMSEAYAALDQLLLELISQSPPPPSREEAPREGAR